MRAERDFDVTTIKVNLEAYAFPKGLVGWQDLANTTRTLEEETDYLGIPVISRDIKVSPEKS